MRFNLPDVLFSTWWSRRPAGYAESIANWTTWRLCALLDPIICISVDKSNPEFESNLEKLSVWNHEKTLFVLLGGRFFWDLVVKVGEFKLLLIDGASDADRSQETYKYECKQAETGTESKPLLRNKFNSHEFNTNIFNKVAY